ncbi:InlB B-repeat-containing protein [Castellaniella hirudinis]|uniref:InlB B-repeat-containing protein n=1 Tax=Castellaniella hirudinis TaxID=1144617 RepID=UPI0039C0C9CA
MAASTAAGTQIGLSAQKPATYDAVGYGALNYTPIGEITDAGTHGRVYQAVTANILATRGTRKFKGSFNEGTKSIQMLLDDDDAGQILAKQALNSDDEYSFCVTYPDGSKDYFPALVMSYQKQASTVDTVLGASMDLEITTSKDGVGVVEAGPDSPVSFTLTYTAGADGSLIGVSPQTVNEGGAGSAVAAVADLGFVFDQWSDGVKANPRTDVNVTGDVTVTAEFLPE